MNNGTCIEVRQLAKTYQAGSGSFYAIRGVNLSIRKGEFLSIIGPSGCGKSTFLHLLGGLTTPTEGTITIEGKQLTGLSDAALSRYRGRATGFVFQRFNLLPTLSIYGNIAMAQKIRGISSSARDIDAILERVGLISKKLRKPSELSIGEQQRAAIARAVVHRPGILLADEPTGNLDSANSNNILELFIQMHREFNQTILMVTHNREVAEKAEKIIVMRDGEIVDGQHSTINGPRVTGHVPQ